MKKYLNGIAAIVSFIAAWYFAIQYGRMDAATFCMVHAIFQFQLHKYVNQ